GGYIGLELGTVYAALGSKVTVVELTDGLLPGVDRELVRPLQTRLATHFDKIYLSTKVAKLEKTDKGVKATLEGEEVTVKTARFPWQASGRAMTLGRTDGLTKLVLDAAGDRVLGVGIVGEGAGELIAEAVLAIEMGASATDLAMTIHPHPTLTETVGEAA